MKLTEILDSKIDFKITNDTNDWLSIESEIDGQNYVFSAESFDNYWEITFINSKTGFRLTKNNNGNEFKIFTLVGKLIDLLIKKHNPNIIRMGAANGENRLELYKKLAKKIPGFTLSTDDSGDAINIILTKVI